MKRQAIWTTLKISKSHKFSPRSKPAAAAMALKDGYLLIGSYQDGAHSGSKGAHYLPATDWFRQQLCEQLGDGKDTQLLSKLQTKSLPAKACSIHTYQAIVNNSNFDCKTGTGCERPRHPESHLQLQYYASPLDAYERWSD